jgi:methionyl-tRNA formyltransferase
MRIAMFGIASPISHSCLAAIAGAGHEVLFVMEEVPFRRKAKQALLRRWPASEDFARRAGIPRIRYRDARDGKAIARFRPDIVCIAAFRSLVPESIAALAPLGAINFHPSRLPRHRGPRPLFWTYYHGDPDIGLTVHRATPRFDAGPIITQTTLPVPRGYRGEQLLGDVLAQVGPTMLDAIAAVRAGKPERAQPEVGATRAPRPDPSRFRMPLDRWDVEQTWHFLKGVLPGFRPLLRDAEGERVHYKSVGSFARADPTLPAGAVVPGGSGWLLHANGGTIDLVR